MKIIYLTVVFRIFNYPYGMFNDETVQLTNMFYITTPSSHRQPNMPKCLAITPPLVKINPKKTRTKALITESQRVSTIMWVINNI